MKEGNLVKERWEYFKEHWITKQGIWDRVLGGFIWGLILVNFTKPVYFWIQTKIFGFITIQWLNQGVSYILYGMLLSPVGLGITFFTIFVYKLLFNNLKKMFKRK